MILAFETWEDLIRTGKLQQARKALLETLSLLSSSNLNVDEIVRLASYCRRAGLYSSSLRLLNPIVHPKAREPGDAPPSARIEYASALINLGAIQEGSWLLERIDLRRHPQAALFLAFAHFSRWDYGTSLPLLRRYVLHPVLSAYERRIGYVNLFSALVHDERFDELDELYPRIARELEESGQKLLHGNVLEIYAQRQIARRSWSSAASLLERARAELRDSEGSSAFFVRKWQLLLELWRSPGSRRRSLEPALRSFQEEARKRRFWEMDRNCDAHWARACGDPAVFEHVYFGTPHAAFRRKLLEKCGRRPPSGSYRWALGPGSEPCELNAFTGARENPLKPGQALQRLLHALSSDFYKPWTLPALHASVFPERHYNPLSSPVLMRQLISRLRRWAGRGDVPVVIREKGGFYALEATGPLQVILPDADGLKRDFAVSHSLEPWLLKLRGEIPASGEFTRSGAAALWKIPNRSANRILRDAVATGEVIALGSGPTARYALPEGITS